MKRIILLFLLATPPLPAIDVWSMGKSVIHYLTNSTKKKAALGIFGGMALCAYGAVMQKRYCTDAERLDRIIRDLETISEKKNFTTEELLHLKKAINALRLNFTFTPNDDQNMANQLLEGNRMPEVAKTICGATGAVFYKKVAGALLDKTFILFGNGKCHDAQVTLDKIFWATKWAKRKSTQPTTASRMMQAVGEVLECGGLCTMLGAMAYGIYKVGRSFF